MEIILALFVAAQFMLWTAVALWIGALAYYIYMIWKE